MSSGFAPHNAGVSATKSANSSSSNNFQTSQSASQSSGSAPIAFDTSRRSGSGGAGSSGRGNQASPRNSQGNRKNHKNHRKPDTPRFDDDPEYLTENTLMSSTGVSRRGMSITHLMNWNVPSRPQDHHYHSPRTYRSSPRRTWGLGSGYHEIDKARYVNANYRFIVDPKGDYRAQSVDSDVHVPWDNVLQVLASEQSQSTNCPICLDVPTAPRMSKCGHIFCLPCAMRFMANSDDPKSYPETKKHRSKKCPICGDGIYMPDFRPLRWFTGQEKEVKVGQTATLRLMVRHYGSTLALPLDSAGSPLDEDGIPWYNQAEVTDFARIIKGARDYMEAQYKDEVEALRVMGREDELMFQEEGVWTRKAISALRKLLAEMGSSEPGPPVPAVIEKEETPKPVRPELKVNDNPDEVPEMYHIMHAMKSGQVTPVHRAEAELSTPANIPKPSEGATDGTNTAPLAHIPKGPKNSKKPNKPSVPDDRRSKPGENSQASYYFYRALPHYYLSPLDIRILRAAFGPYTEFPPAVYPKIENITTGHSVDDEFRKRTKYLAHLPYGTEVAMLECDWTGIVADAVLDKFRPEMERRRKRKLDKDTQEEKARLRAEKEEGEARWAFERSTSRRRAAFTDDDFVALAIARSQQEMGAPRVDDDDDDGARVPPEYAAASASASASPPTSQQQPGPSSSAGPASRTVWGTPAIAAAASSYEMASPPRHANDGWNDGWEADYLLEEDLIAHHHLDDGLSRTPGASPMGVGKGGSNKRNKKKKVTLMTNGGKRGA